MNERIHTLAEEAGLYCDGTPDAWDQEAIEKFAQSLIQECVQCINNRTEDWNAKLLWTFDDGTYMDVNVDSILKDHFDGVVD